MKSFRIRPSRVLTLAVTLGAVLMIAIPAAIVVALLGSMFAKHER